METARAQFEKEAAALVQIIRDTIAAGQVDEASELLEQYALLNPSDPQIAELRGEVKKIQGDGLAQGDGSPVLSHIESIFILPGFGMKRSGFLASIYGKIRLMEEKLDYKSTILTIRHDIDLRKTEVWLKTSSGTQAVMSPGTKLLNVYEHYQKSYAQGLANKAVYEKTDNESGLRYEKRSEKLYDVYDGETRMRQDIYTGYSGSLRLERFYRNGKVDKDIYYDDWGYINNVREYNRGDEEVYTAKYYTIDGELCIEAFFDTGKNEFDPIKLFLYNENGEVTAEFNSNEELTAYYLSHELHEDRFYLLVFESGMVAKIAGLLDKKHRNIAKVSIVHSIFLKDAYKPSSPPQQFYEYLCKKPNEFDGIVLLTQAARRDFTNLYGCKESTFVIAHPYPYEIEHIEFKRRDNRKAVAVSRLFSEKQVDVTVEIFSYVVKALPDVKLEIYGVGPEHEKIEAQIKRLGMENNIFIMGYTDDAVSVYRDAALSIMTSAAEGYGLTIVESICNGCPAFSHDIKYGPSEIISEGKTGFLFPRNDKRDFAKKITEYFEDVQLQRKMSENCYADASRFSCENFIDNWLGMVETLYERKGQ